MDQEKLNKILEKHQLWLEDKEGGKRADLSDADLRGADLWGVNFSGADLRRADLSDADLSDADLSDADLWGANFSGADLRRADLDYSCWPLWCGTLDVKLCDKLQAQLLFHAFKVSKIKPTEEQKEFIKKNFHRYEECGGL